MRRRWRCISLRRCRNRTWWFLLSSELVCRVGGLFSTGFSEFRALGFSRETVESVSILDVARNTALKRGENEICYGKSKGLNFTRKRNLLSEFGISISS